MIQVTKAEQLKLPEQLYILLVNPETGEPQFSRQKVERALAVSILWELLHASAFETTGNTVTSVRQAMFDELYLRRAAVAAVVRVPVDGRELGWEIAAQLNPVWEAIGEDMVAKHLLTKEVRTRFVFFHRRVLMELGEARSDAVELSADLSQAARNLWDPNYDDELARTHPRLLARLVLLDNCRLLEPLIGAPAYAGAAPHLARIRTQLHEMVTEAQTAKAVGASYVHNNTGAGSWSVYDSCTDFWIYSDGGSSDGSHQGHGGHDGNDGNDASSDGTSDSGGGGDGGGCGGCGGCGS